MAVPPFQRNPTRETKKSAKKKKEKKLDVTALRGTLEFNSSPKRRDCSKFKNQWKRYKISVVKWLISVPGIHVVEKKIHSFLNMHGISCCY